VVLEGTLAWTGWGDVVTMGSDPQLARPSPDVRAADDTVQAQRADEEVERPHAAPPGRRGPDR
jgi:hypothetical protein